ncbi:MAG: right-handed parallel beta-helix repeat-containing protein, partial [Deltaproteobacteria bacterium]|nr:right-handed parallel beta-helix repeat-containing protein [Deltaproteobacteria bacterium]
MWPKKILFFLYMVFAATIFPIAASAAVVDVSGTVSADTIWTSDNVYRVTGDITLNPGIKLTIEAGTVVKFNAGRRLYVNNGILSAVGEAGNKIVFTSYRDDSAGGDTNGDGYSTGQAGDWRNLYFYNAIACPHQPCEAGDTGSELQHVIIRYGGSDNNGSLNLRESDISVLSSEVSHSSSHGIYIQDCSPLIEGNTISDNGVGNSSYGNGLYLYRNYGSVSPVIRGNTISGNHTNGIYASNATPTLEDNTISGNGGWGIYFEQATATPELKGNTVTGNYRSLIVPASALLGSGAAPADANILAPNTINGVWIRGNARSSDLTFARLYTGEAYEINTYQIYDTLTMESGSKLTVSEGVVVKFYSGAGLNINGALSAVGTAALPVVFTSWRDDRYGGDLNLDGYGSAPANGDWRGIYFSNQATDGECLIDHTVIRYGGDANSGLVYSYQTDFTIQNSVLSNSSTNGIRSYYASLTLSGNEIYANTGDGLYLHGSGMQTISGCKIYANIGDG